MIPALEIEHLTKRYGTRVAVDDLSIAVSPGCIYGLLGRNGAGKSSTISCALGLARSQAGDVRFFGETRTSKLFERVAYVPEITVLETWMTAREHGELRARVFKRFDRTRYAEFLERFEIRDDVALRRLSKGQRQTVAVSLAFAQRADLLVLDEPASGLDPFMQRRLLDALVNEAVDGAAVLFSSHNIAHVEAVAERVGIIDRGRLVLDEPLEEVRANSMMLEAYFAQVPSADDVLRLLGEDASLQGPLVRIPVRGDLAELRDRLARLEPAMVNERASTLESIFLQTVAARGEEL